MLENICLRESQEDDPKDLHLWEEVMSAQKQAHQLLVEKLNKQHLDEIVQKENELRLELTAKIKDLEGKHFEEVRLSLEC